MDTARSADQVAIAGSTGIYDLIFGFAIAAVISIITGGKLVGRHINLIDDTGDYINVRIPAFLRFRARGNEAILGFAGYSSTFTFMAIFWSPRSHAVFRYKVGLALDQYYSLCFVSAFVFIFVAFIFSIYMHFSQFSASRTLSSENRKLSTLLDQITRNLHNDGGDDE